MLEGKSVRLREYHKKDIPTLWKFVNDVEIRRNLVVGIPYPWRLEEEEKWYEEQSANGDLYNFAIERKEDGRYIGGCGINKVDWKNSVATVGIFLGKEFLSQGYGSDAMRVLVKFIFDQMNIHKVALHVFSFNKRAINSYKKVGFKVEGILREQIFRDGKYHDEVVMGMLRGELLP